MAKLEEYLLTEDPDTKKKVKEAILRDITKDCYIIKDLKNKVDYLKTEISGKEQAVKAMLYRVNEKESQVLSVVKAFGIKPLGTTKLVLKDVEISCKETSVLSTDPTFDQEDFSRYETTIVCQTKAERQALLDYITSQSLTIKEEVTKIEALSLKKHLKTWVLKGARLVSNYKLSYKFK
jgi:hypothetical protein